MDKVLQLKSQINNYIFDALNEESFKEKFKNLIACEARDTIISKKDELLTGETYKIFRNSIKINSYKTFKSKGFKEAINSFIDNNLKNLESSNITLESIIPATVVNGIKVYIYNHKDEILNTLRSFINSDNVDKKLLDEITNVLSGISPMVSRFVNVGNIHSRFKTGIDDYLDNEKNMLEIINMINSQLDGLMKKRVSEIVSQFPAEGINSLINSISDGIIKSIASEKFIDMILDKLEDAISDALSSIDETSESTLNNLQNILKDFIGALYNKVLENNKTKELINIFTDNLVDNLLNKPLISFIEE